MKKLFNNSIKGNETQNQSIKSKRKFLKTFSFTSLALLMSIAGTMAFAPLGASPSVANANEMVETSTEQGLITPKADDPVIYTTESGLDIKWGNAICDAVGGGNEEGFSNLSSGNLKNLPYFTTKSGSTTYTWVVIGQNLSSYHGFSYQNLTYWQTNKSQSGTYAYFFDNIYETTTPAGSAIKNNNILNDYAARKTIGTSLLSSVTQNTTEIPAGCVLVLANECVENGAYNVSYAYGMDAYRFAHYRGDSNTDFRAKMDGYYTNKSLGLSSFINQNLIPSVTIKTYEYQWYAPYYGTDSGGSWAWRLPSLNAYIFPLCARADGSTFTWSTYLTASQMKLSVNQWLRGGGNGTNTNLAANGKNYFLGEYMDTSGNLANTTANIVYGYRPAFCLKLV